MIGRFLKNKGVKHFHYMPRYGEKNERSYNCTYGNIGRMDYAEAYWAKRSKKEEAGGHRMKFERFNHRSANYNSKWMVGFILGALIILVLVFLGVDILPF